ncbi:MAG: glycosyltransferase [Gemmatimonadetes bacterium]|nr:glycosyltransferase [Gemmatimonadota bacterium]
MRLLLVCYWYAPFVNPRTFRWGAVAERWAAQGHHVDVVTVGVPGLADREVVNGVHLHRLREGFLGRARSMFPASGPPQEAAQAAAVREPARLRAARWVYGHSWRKVYWPDFACLWYFAARGAALRLAERAPYDGVVSVSDPFTDHLVGLALRRRLRRHRWVVDFGDPFSFLEHTPTNNHALYGRLNVRAERAVFREADAVAVTTGPTRDIYAGLFPEAAGRIHVVPPLAPALESVPPHPPVFAGAGRVRLVYPGTLLRAIRDPGFLLRLFEALQRTRFADAAELHLLGTVGDCGSFFEPYREWIGRKVFLHGRVVREYAVQAMREASVLVNLGNDTPYQLPSKILEYAALGKPVLNLVKSEDDSSARFLAAYPRAQSWVDSRGPLDPAEVERRLEALLATPVPGAGDLPWLEAHGPERIADEYMRLMTGRRSGAAHPTLTGAA